MKTLLSYMLGYTAANIIYCHSLHTSGSTHSPAHSPMLQLNLTPQQASHVDLEPLLDNPSTHGTVDPRNSNMTMTDGHHDVGTPLTHDHVTTGQYSRIGQLLVAHLASEHFRHGLVGHWGWATGLGV